MKPLRLIILTLFLSVMSFQILAEDPLPSVVNINTADVATLSQILKGVGEAKAKSIVAFRKANGSFKSADDLTAVKGIGESLVNKNRERIKTE